METISATSRGWHRTLSVATTFWAICLVLVIAEATIGSNFVISALFFFSIPLLVALLTWVNLGMVFKRTPHQLWSIVALGGTVLGSSTLIVLVGLVAAAKLKVLLAG